MREGEKNPPRLEAVMLYLTILKGTSPAEARTILAIQDQEFIRELSHLIVEHVTRPPCKAKR